MANKFDMGKVEKQVRTQLEASLVLMGRTAKTFFTDNFRKQGFEDRGVSKWDARKKETKKSQGRAILVKTGDLRRSIKLDTINRANLSVRISSDLPYSRVHNDGNEGIVHSVGFHTRTATRKVGNKRVKRMSTQNVKEHFRIGGTPQRQFIGDSWSLNEKVKKVIVTNLNKAFK
ncbi:MAG: phage virion morphogenesis protein [Bacteroidetes bacterium]|nr:phage virion morphogenesis protein [Bacteroidota bacterium]